MEPGKFCFFQIITLSYFRSYDAAIRCRHQASLNLTMCEAISGRVFTIRCVATISSDTRLSNLAAPSLRQKRSFLPVSPALRQINRLGWTKPPGKTLEVLARF
jgi:hypothetical protein